MKVSDIKDLIKEVQQLQGNDNIILSFSTGADALASFLRIVEAGIEPSKIKLFYLFYGVMMSWTEEYIEYFEDRFKTKITLLPSYNFLSDLGNGLFQTPFRNDYIFKEQKRTKYEWLPILHNKDLENIYKDFIMVAKDTFVAVGVKSGDSAIRRIAMRKMQGINQNKKKWYPIWDFENSDVINIIKKHNLKVPYDYKLFGISFEQTDYRFLKPIQEECPNNYKKLCEFFPMLPTLITRHEFYKKTEPKKGIKLKQLKDLVLMPKKDL